MSDVPSIESLAAQQQALSTSIGAIQEMLMELVKAQTSQNPPMTLTA
jgi:hypothetical protein